jgi:hypothetical protein
MKPAAPADRRRERRRHRAERRLRHRVGACWAAAIRYGETIAKRHPAALAARPTRNGETT